MYKKRRNLTITILLLLILVVLSLTIQSIVFWNNVFLVGLFCFICGGILLILKKGIFNNMFYSFRVFLKNSSKLQMYVSEKDEVTTTKHLPSNNFIVTYFLLIGGVILIGYSTSISFFIST
ncbi:DUF3899 domain-containing protein [Virgibacillus necropolis]